MGSNVFQPHTIPEPCILKESLRFLLKIKKNIVTISDTILRFFIGTVLFHHRLRYIISRLITKENILEKKVY